MSALGRALRAARWVLLVAVCLMPLFTLRATQAQPRATWTVETRVSHYDETGYAGCGDALTEPDTAACSWDIPCGARVTFADGYTVTCNGRGGGLGSGDACWQDTCTLSWVDVWKPGGWNIDAAYGPVSVVTVETE